MTPFFSEVAQKAFLKPFRISESEVRKVLDSPDQQQQITYGKAKYALLAKRIRSGRLESRLVVFGRVSGDVMTIDFALRVPWNVAVPDDASPVQILEAIVNKYGYECVIGDRRARFTYYLTIPVPDLKENMPVAKVIHPPGSTQGVLMSIVAVQRPQGQTPYVEVTLCFCLDVERYRRAIGA